MILSYDIIVWYHPYDFFLFWIPTLALGESTSQSETRVLRNNLFLEKILNPLGVENKQACEQQQV